MKEIQSGDILRKNGLKATPVREALVDVLRLSPKPLSIKDIEARIEKKIGKADTVTLYRTVHTLEEKDIIQSVHWGREALLYEISRNHHHHLVCTKCGDVEDVHACDFPKIESVILKSSKKFKEITKHSFELFGICRSCIQSLSLSKK